MLLALGARVCVQDYENIDKYAVLPCTRHQVSVINRLLTLWRFESEHLTMKNGKCSIIQHRVLVGWGVPTVGGVYFEWPVLLCLLLCYRATSPI